ncbi:hypothetical protein Y032_0436g1445 [Ancylostoma ceylanicum]|uniref:Uncharacterized protein n=1 Tax=Ancylostoma ceylanicum TaxID=53326 RepID=A0A016X1R8_9BILA|nr:hypothetical protein Y032_0436g1445 [Ancylostoma ceylanicum]
MPSLLHTTSSDLTPQIECNVTGTMKALTVLGYRTLYLECGDWRCSVIGQLDRSSNHRTRPRRFFQV